MTVENLSQGTTYNENISDALTWDQQGNNEPITIGASQRATPDNSADNLDDYFFGTVEAVAIYDSIQAPNALPCFSADTLIRSDRGAVRAGDIKKGQMILTKDHGCQPVRWAARRKLGSLDLLLNPRLRPVRISACALGNGLPNRDLLVSRQHRMLVASPIAKRMFGTAQVFVAAVKLTGLPGIALEKPENGIEYVHFMFDAHSVVYAEGAPAESLFIGKETLKSLGADNIAELREIFPQLDKAGVDMPAAAPIPTGQRQKKLISRHRNRKKPVLDTTRLCPDLIVQKA